MCTALLILIEPAPGARKEKCPPGFEKDDAGGNTHRITKTSNLRYFNRLLTTL
jgi:hypothetical protein